jgi:hypothetical protein
VDGPDPTDLDDEGDGVLRESTWLESGPAGGRLSIGLYDRAHYGQMLDPVPNV